MGRFGSTGKKLIAIVPARGGSKGLPRKNILSLNGKPLIHYTLEAALSSKNIDRVLVSTDDEEIAEVALSVPGVEVPFMRPDSLAEDSSSAIDVYLHVVDELADKEGTILQSVCVLLPTSPLRIPLDIDNCIELYNSSHAHFVVSVQKTKPLAWHLFMEKNGLKLDPVIEIDGKSAIANRQALGNPPVVLNGSVYVLNVPILRKTRSYYGSNTVGYIMPTARSIDIDNEEDFKMAEALVAASSIK